MTARGWSAPRLFQALLVLAVLATGIVQAVVGRSPQPSDVHSLTAPLASLLAPPPRGWFVLVPPHELSAVDVSDGFGAQREVLRSLHHDSFGRGVGREIRGPDTTYIDEQLWQYARIAGATAFFEEYVAKSSPGPESGWETTFGLADRGVGFAGSNGDGAYQGAALVDENDILVQLEVTSHRPVTQAVLSNAVRQAIPPVAQGIRVVPVPVPTPLSFAS